MTEFANYENGTLTIDTYRRPTALSTDIDAVLGAIGTGSEAVLVASIDTIADKVRVMETMEPHIPAPVVYMNVATGSVDDRDGWWYEDEDGNEVNAVDNGEVVEVRWDKRDQNWEEV